MNSEWIKISERKPGYDDFPIAVYSPNRPLDGDDNNDGIYFRVRGQTIYPDVTHWMPAKLPAPPPKEKTQKELDEDEFFSGLRVGKSTLEIWHAALKWEREQVGAMLSKPLHNNQERWGVLNMDDMNALRKRCGL